MAEFNDIELFEQAMRDKLSPEHAELFNRRIEKDGAFRADFEKFRTVIKNIRQQKRYEELLVLLNENYKSRDWSTDPVKTNFSKSRLILGVVTAVVVVGAAIVAFSLTRNLPEHEVAANQSTIEDTAEPPKVPGENTLAVEASSGQPEEMTTTDSAVVEEGNPSAFMINQKGYFITQYKPISEARFLRLRQNDTTEYKAEMVLYDQELDVAVLRLNNGSWNSSNRLPYRLATTQAYQNTAIMAVGRKGGELLHKDGTITALEKDGSFNFYDVELDTEAEFAGGPVISKNGNVVAFISVTDEGTNVIKSTHLVGLLARSADDPDMADYLHETNNRLAALEREVQLERIDPFVLEVIRFY